jgi:hypothetical protein
MIGLLHFVLAVVTLPFKSKLRLEAENAVLRNLQDFSTSRWQLKDNVIEIRSWQGSYLWRRRPRALRRHAALVRRAQVVRQLM